MSPYPAWTPIALLSECPISRILISICMSIRNASSFQECWHWHHIVSLGLTKKKRTEPGLEHHNARSRHVMMCAADSMPTDSLMVDEL